MKLFHRKLTYRNAVSVDVPAQEVGVDGPQEPLGHVHPNFRHWTWSRPTDLQK